MTLKYQKTFLVNILRYFNLKSTAIIYYNVPKTDNNKWYFFTVNHVKC